MFIIDLFETELSGYRDARQDNSVIKSGDLRKSRLTLSQIKRLRQMNDIKKYENQQKVKDVAKQYRPAAVGVAPGF